MPTPPRTNGRHLTAFALILGGTVFGFVLASGLATTPDGFAQGETQGPIEVPGADATVRAMPDFATLSEAIQPAVVSIQSSRIERDGRRGRRESDPLDFFFGPRRRQPGDLEGPQREDSTGSGFVISGSGLVVTNNHVIEDADQVTVSLGRRRYPAEVRGRDEATDVALLQIDVGRPLAYLKLGDSDALRVGEWIMVVGSPLQLDQSVTVGVVSAKGRSLDILDSSFENFIQTDAAINFGNSGGPLVNLRGEVVGIATLINWGAENIGFAVPVNTLKQILPQLRDTGKVTRGYLGVQIGDVDFEIAEAFGLDEPQGVLVNQVLPGEPADRAGIEHGDILMEVDGRPIVSTRELIDYVSAKGPGEKVEMSLLRNGKRLARTVDLGERPTAGESPAEPVRGEESGIDWLGIRYQDLTPPLRQMHGIPEDVSGLWITAVAPTSPLWDEGVRNDGIIYIASEVNGRPVADVAAFEEIAETARSGSRLRIYLRRFFGGEEVAPQFVFPRVP